MKKRDLNFLVAIACLSAFAMNTSSAGVMSRIKGTVSEYAHYMTLPVYYNPKGVMVLIKDTMNEYQLAHLTNLAHYTSKGVVERMEKLKDTIHDKQLTHSTKGVYDKIRETAVDYQLTNLTNLIQYSPKGVMEKIKHTMSDYQLTNLTFPAQYLSKGVLDKIKDTMNDYHLVNVTIPAQYMPKRLWQTLMSTRFTIHVPQIPLVSGLLRRSNSTKEESRPVSSVSPGSPPSVSPNKLNGVASETSSWCGGNVLLDLNSRKEVTYKSTNFPGPRSRPYACSWDVKVAKNCKKGLVTLKLDERSRLPEQEKCTKGYFRISPFMKEAKLCGPIGTAPAFQWFVDPDSHQPSEEVSIIMKNIGLDDGHAEGIAFSIRGDCLQKEINQTAGVDEGPDGTLVKNFELSTRWMRDIISQSKATDDGHKKGKLGVITLYAANMSLDPVSKLSSHAADKAGIEHFSAHSFAPHAVLEPILDAGDDPGLKPNNIVLYSPLYLLFKRFGWLVK